MPRTVLPSGAVEYGPVGWPDPRRTLFPPIARWAKEYLRLPDGPNAGDPWTFTRQQSRYLAHWYSITDRGHFVYSQGVCRLCKGAGKDPLAAALALIDLCCPHVVFRRWDENGFPVGQPHASPWVQIAAVSRDQTETTMSLFSAMASEQLRDEYGVRVGKTLVYAGEDDAHKIQAVTSNPLSLEGKRPTLVIPNEVQNWFKSNQGHAMAGVINGNLAKSRGGLARRLSLCNAHVPGRDSIGERLWATFEKQEAGELVDESLLYFALEAPPDTKLNDPEQLEAALRATHGDAVWLNPRRIMQDIYDPETSPSESRRKHLNQVVAAEDAWVWPSEWDALGPVERDKFELRADWERRSAEAGREVPKLQPRDQITLGLDPSKSEDHTALIATEVVSGNWVTLGVWLPQECGHEPRHPDSKPCSDRVIDFSAVDAAVKEAHKLYDVVAFFSDVHPFESYVDAWNRKFGHKYCVKATSRNAIAFDMRTREKEFVLEGAVRVRQEIREGRFRHDGHRMVRVHIHNARAQEREFGENLSGATVGKESRRSPRKIDSAPAGILSRMAWRLYCALPPSKQRRKRTGRASF